MTVGAIIRKFAGRSAIRVGDTPSSPTFSKVRNQRYYHLFSSFLIFDSAILERNKPPATTFTVHRSSYLITCILTSLFILLLCVFVVTLTYFKRDGLRCRRKHFLPVRPAEGTEAESLTIDSRCQLLLVYDLEDAFIATRAAVLREQFISSGVSKVKPY